MCMRGYTGGVATIRIYPYPVIKECRSIVRDESSVYFNVTAVNRYDI